MTLSPFPSISEGLYPGLSRGGGVSIAAGGGIGPPETFFYKTDNALANQYYTDDALANKYKTTGSYLDPNLGNWRTALAAQNSVAPVIHCLGDSTTWGQYSGLNANPAAGVDQKINSYPTQLRNLFVTSGRAAQANSIIANGGLTSPGRNGDCDLRMVRGAQWAQSNTTFRTVGGYCITKANVTSSPCTYLFDGVADYPIDTFRVWYSRPASGATLTFLVDGVSAGSLNISGGTDLAATFLDFPCGSVGSHTLTINCTDATGSVFGVVNAVFGFNSTAKQISVINSGWPAAQTTSWIEAVNPWSPLNALNQFSPNLTIVCLGINDWLAGLAVATFQSQLNTIVAKAKLAGDVIVMTPAPSKENIRTYSSQVLYVDAMRTVATNNNASFLDIFNLFGTWDLANQNGWMGNDQHPNSAGYGIIAQQVYNRIGNLS